MNPVIQSIIRFLVQSQAFMSTYRLAFIAIAGLALGCLGIWAFAFRPQTLIVVVLLMGLAYGYGDTVASWIKGKGAP